MTVPSLHNCKVVYQRVLDQRQAEFDAHFSDGKLSKLHQEAHVRLTEMETLYDAVSSRRERSFYSLAAQLFADGLCQLASANYRLAFYCLRGFLELTSAGVRNSAFELDLREWAAGRRDISWTAIVSEDSGCYSKPFIRSFAPGMEADAPHYLALAKRAYRECSEYVHGNPSSHGLTHAIDATRAEQWFELCEVACAASMFAFVARYLEDLVNDPACQLEVFSIVSSEFGHIDFVKNELARRGV